jgi:16S rRNA C967 or C1407 C5-methylase (RsmB/RsmF family)
MCMKLLLYHRTFKSDMLYKIYENYFLSHALKIVEPGGTVVYSTCSLSPIQNDGVVHMALRKVWEETDIQVIVK